MCPIFRFCGICYGAHLLTYAVCGTRMYLIVSQPRSRDGDDCDVLAVPVLSLQLDLLEGELKEAGDVDEQRQRHHRNHVQQHLAEKRQHCVIHYLLTSSNSATTGTMYSNNWQKKTPPWEALFVDRE